MSDIETPNWLTDEPCWLRDEPSSDNNRSNSSIDDIIGCYDDDDIIDWLCEDGVTDMKVAQASAAMAERSKLDDFRQQLNVMNLAVGDFGGDDCVFDHVDGFRFRQSDQKQYCTAIGLRDQLSCSDTLQGSPPSSLTDTTTDAKCMNPDDAGGCNEIRPADDRCSSEAATDHETFKDCLADDLQDLTSFESSLNIHVGLCGGTVGMIRSHSGTSNDELDSCIGSPQNDPSSSMGAADDQAVAILGTGSGGGTSNVGIFSNSALISAASISSSFAALIPSAAGELYSHNYNNSAVLSHAKSLPLRYLHGTPPHNEDTGGGTVPLFSTGGNPAAAAAPFGSVQELLWSSNSSSNTSNIACLSSSSPSELMKPAAAAAASAASPYAANAITAVFRSQDGAIPKDGGIGTGQLALLRSRLAPRIIDVGAADAGINVVPMGVMDVGASDAGMNVASGHVDGMPPSSKSGVHDLSSLHWKSPAAKTRAARKRRMAKSRLPPAAIQRPAAAKGWPSISPPGTSTQQGSGKKATVTKKTMQEKDRGNECLSKGGGGTKKVPSPPPAALDLPHEKRSGPGNVNAPPRFLLQKELKPSDVGTLGRIVLPKRDAEAHLPDLTAREGINLVMEDLVNSKVWNLRFRFWPNNKSRMYLLENTRDFVKTHNLQEGDFLMIYKDDQSGKYSIRAKKVARLDHASNNASSGRKLQRSSSQGINLGNGCHMMSDNVKKSANSGKDSDMEASFQVSLTMQDMVTPKLEHDSLPCVDDDTKIEINDIHIEEMFEL